MNCGQVLSEGQAAAREAASVSIVQNSVTCVSAFKLLKYIYRYPAVCFVLKRCLGILFDSPLHSLGTPFVLAWHFENEVTDV